MRVLFVLCLVAALTPGTLAETMRIKDITDLGGARDNQLIGYGLVIGLQGTGDSLNNAPFTELSMRWCCSTRCTPHFARRWPGTGLAAKSRRWAVL